VSVSESGRHKDPSRASGSCGKVRTLIWWIVRRQYRNGTRHTRETNSRRILRPERRSDARSCVHIIGLLGEGAYDQPSVTLLWRWGRQRRRNILRLRLTKIKSDLSTPLPKTPAKTDCAGDLRCDAVAAVVRRGDPRRGLPDVAGAGGAVGEAGRVGRAVDLRGCGAVRRDERALDVKPASGRRGVALIETTECSEKRGEK